MLLQYIDGFPLSKLTDHVPPSRWLDVCQLALRVVNAVSDYKILNKDVRPDNFLVEKVMVDGYMMYSVFQFDFAWSRSRHAEEEESYVEWNWDKAKAKEDIKLAVAMQDINSVEEDGELILQDISAESE